MAMTFGGTIRELRRKEGIGIKKLAPRLRVDHTYLSKLENDRAMPGEELVGRFAKYFKYDADELLVLADRIPEDVRQILRENPREAINFLRKRFLCDFKRPST